jgi:antirestriction protein
MNEEPQQPSPGEEREAENRPSPQVYIASLSDYNAGRLYGRWIDAAQTAEALHAAISEMLAASPTPGAEEWAIHDFEGFGPLRLSEYESIDMVSAVAQGIAEHGPAFAAWAADVGTDQSDELARFEDCFMGHWESVEAYAGNLVDDLGIESAIEDAAGSLAPYVRVDTEALARDLVLSGDLSVSDAPDGGVYLFSP